MSEIFLGALIVESPYLNSVWHVFALFLFIILFSIFHVFRKFVLLISVVTVINYCLIIVYSMAVENKLKSIIRLALFVSDWKTTANGDL